MADAGAGRAYAAEVPRSAKSCWDLGWGDRGQGSRRVCGRSYAGAGVWEGLCAPSAPPGLCCSGRVTQDATAAASERLGVPKLGGQKFAWLESGPTRSSDSSQALAQDAPTFGRNGSFSAEIGLETTTVSGQNMHIVRIVRYFLGLGLTVAAQKVAQPNNEEIVWALGPDVRQITCSVGQGHVARGPNIRIPKCSEPVVNTFASVAVVLCGDMIGAARAI